MTALRHAFESQFLIGVEAPAEVPNSHHLLPRMGRLTGRYGMALCGFPVEYLHALSNGSWDELDEANRCTHCQAETGSGQQAIAVSRRTARSAHSTARAARLRIATTAVLLHGSRCGLNASLERLVTGQPEPARTSDRVAR